MTTLSALSFKEAVAADAAAAAAVALATAALDAVAVGAAACCRRAGTSDGATAGAVVIGDDMLAVADTMRGVSSREVTARCDGGRFGGCCVGSNPDVAVRMTGWGGAPRMEVP